MNHSSHYQERPSYPAGLIRHISLPDGGAVTIRPIRPEDATSERDFLNSLSADSKFQRFMFTIRELTPEMLSRFMEIDYEREMALIAVLDTPHGERLVGIARYDRLPDGQSCEFSIVVADDWQGKGLASQLMKSLISAARDRGLHVMEGFRLLKNARMQDLARSLGFRSGADPDDPHLVRMRLVLSRTAFECDQDPDDARQEDRTHRA